MFNLEDLKKVTQILGDRGSQNQFSVCRLNGDASDRNFYRLSLKPESIVLMKLPEPHSDGELPFINIWQYLNSCQLPVAQLYNYDQAKGILFLEDLGDITMEEMLKRHPDQQIELYQQAIDLLLLMQTMTSKKQDKSCLAYSYFFDVEKFMWEFNLFIQYFLSHPKNPPTGWPRSALSKIQSYFLEIAVLLDKEPKVFTHRDYHSRNLMIHQGKPKLIDFQDARLGLCQYDLASLLRDSYVALEEEVVDSLVEYYISRREEIEGAKIDRPRFRRIFDYTCLQRNIKVCGTFAYLYYEKANPHYLQYLPQTWSYVNKNLGKYEELKPLQEVLITYLERS